DPSSSNIRTVPDRHPRPLLAAAPPLELALAAGLARPLRRRRRPATRRGLTASPCTDETEPTVERPGRPADHPRPSSRPTRNPFSPHRSKRFRKRPGASRLILPAHRALATASPAGDAAAARPSAPPPV